MNQEEKVRLARERLRAKGKTSKVGGRRRVGKKAKKVNKNSENRKVHQLVGKLGAQKLPDISNINMFTSDNKVIQFKGPEVYGSFQNKTMICLGNPDVQNIEDCIADVITEISPEQLEDLKKRGVIPSTTDANT